MEIKKEGMIKMRRKTITILCASFYDEGAGFTDDGTAGIGVPFSCTRKDGSVDFSFGGEDGIIDSLEFTDYNE